MNRLIFKFFNDYKATSIGDFLCVEFKKGEIVTPVIKIGVSIIIKADYGLYFPIPMEKGTIGDFEFLQNKANEETDHAQII
jgi:hypothetical protein